MVATFGWIEYEETEASTATPTNLNLGSTLASNLVPVTYPITAGTWSYEKWIKGYWSGTFNFISGLHFWMSVGVLATAETLQWTGVQTTYVTPTNEASTITSVELTPTDTVPAINVTIGGTTSGSLSTSGFSDFIVLQASIGTGASAGATNTTTFTLQYDEV